MEKDITYIKYKKTVLIISVIAVVFIAYYITGYKAYIFTGFLFVFVSTIDYFIKKNRLNELYAAYEKEHLNQLKIVNFGL